MDFIYGCMDDGSGLYDFCRLDIKKMKILFKDQLSFNIMNYLIINIVDNCKLLSKIYNFIYVSLREIQRFVSDLTEEKFKKCLKKLKKINLINYEKSRRECIWRIEIL